MADSRKQLSNYASSKYRSLIENLPAEMPSNSACGYHSACYSNFTAQAKAILIPIPSSSQPVSVPSFSTRQSTRSSSVSIGESSTGVLVMVWVLVLQKLSWTAIMFSVKVCPLLKMYENTQLLIQFDLLWTWDALDWIRHTFDKLLG